ncbi:MAG TPA: ribonuclease HII [Longimicrobiaceae bacterium]|nr:ribonuclease HII [Longimicrobiaceae bacterium]
MAKKRRANDERLRDPLSIERGFWSRGVSVLAGVDEVGRGPLAGPVVAAAVILPAGLCLNGADDSKRIPEARREALVGEICSCATAYAVGAASAREIDAVNVRRATALAMQRALARLPVRPDHLLVDGLPVPELGLKAQTAVVEGDHRVHCISCASILAKVVRDRLMARLAARYPQYGWERNKGYGTPEHLEALARFGPTPHHRRSFAPVQLTSQRT